MLDEVFDLFVNLDANDDQLDFPVLYASGRAGYASEDPEARDGDLSPLFKTIVNHVPAPTSTPTASSRCSQRCSTATRSSAAS